jgi:hypothetical protein
LAERTADLTRQKQKGFMPNEEMWKWLINPLVGVRAGPGTPTTLSPRKGPDLTLHRDPSDPDAGQGSGNNQGHLPSKDDKDDKENKSDGDEKGSDVAGHDPDANATDKRQKQQDEEKSKNPNKDRAGDATKKFIELATKNLEKLSDKDLDDIAKGIAVNAIKMIGNAAVDYVVKNSIDFPSLPPIPLDFLAKKVPAFKGAELNIDIKGKITGPDSLMISITFHEQGPKNKSGKALPLRLSLQRANALSSETGTAVDIDGEISIPSKANPDEVSATLQALKDAKLEADFDTTPAYSVTVLSARDNYKGSDFDLAPPPVNRAISVRLRTSIPPMLHKGKDEITEASIRVRINRISAEGMVKLKVHYKPVPAKDDAAPANAAAP